MLSISLACAYLGWRYRKIVQTLFPYWGMRVSLWGFVFVFVLFCFFLIETTGVFLFLPCSAFCSDLARSFLLGVSILLGSLPMAVIWGKSLEF